MGGFFACSVHRSTGRGVIVREAVAAICNVVRVVSREISRVATRGDTRFLVGFIFFFGPFGRIFLSFVSLCVQDRRYNSDATGNCPNGLFTRFFGRLARLVVLSVGLLLAFQYAFRAVFRVRFRVTCRGVERLGVFHLSIFSMEITGQRQVGVYFILYQGSVARCETSC